MISKKNRNEQDLALKIKRQHYFFREAIQNLI